MTAFPPRSDHSPGDGNMIAGRTWFERVAPGLAAFGILAALLVLYAALALKMIGLL